MVKKPKKSRGLWQRKPATKVKGSAKLYRREKKEWGLGDFVESVDTVMKKQEAENPSIRHLHARLSPEWKRVSEKIGRWLNFPEGPEREALREEIVAEGEIATRVLLDFLLSVQREAKK